MNRFALIVFLILVSTGSWGEISCPDDSSAVCMVNSDTICPSSAKCVSNDVICLDKNSCAGGSFICDTSYDKLMGEYKEAAGQYDVLVSENVSLRNERLEKRNCVRKKSLMWSWKSTRFLLDIKKVLI